MRRAITNVLIVIALIAAILAAIRIYPHDPLRSSTLSTAYFDRHGALLRLTLADDDHYRLWTPLDRIAPETIRAVLRYEDQWFYYHAGFNPMALIRGAYSSFIAKTARRGGSTITMQLARLRWNLNTRSIRGKCIQILRAAQLELYYSKDQILEAYLNEAPYGRNIVGIGAASMIYFDKEPFRLTLPESLTLAVLPQSPGFRVDKSSRVIGEPLFAARQRLLLLWEKRYHVDPLTRALFDLPLTLRQPEALPFNAPHFVEQVRHQLYSAGKHKSRVTTTLDLSFQKLLENHVRRYIRQRQSQGLTNAGALIVHRTDDSIVAQVGSASYFNHAISGQINGAAVKRSPGSTLKPFIYALAIDQGIIHAMTVLKDVPTAFSSYTPENFDGEFNGPLSATDALIKSRNVPAVELNAKLKNPNFYQFLKSAGMTKMASAQHYGLALALGGGEVTMQEVAKLYTMLANDGVLRELRFTEDDPISQGTRLISKEAAFITRDMLARLPRANGVLSATRKIPIYWKTGTSWGFRDAWSTGIVGDYIVVVWLGNFNHKGAPELIGAKSAAPLFFDIADAIMAKQTMADLNRVIPDNVKRVEICLASGDLVTKWCQRKGETWFIPGVSPIKVDTIYRPVFFNPKTQKPICPEDVKPDTIVRVFEYYESDIRDVFQKAGFPKRAPPDLRHCKNEWNAQGAMPSIITPLLNTRYTIFPDNPKRRDIALTASADATAQTLYWFADNNYIGKATPKESLLWQPKKEGKIALSVIDDHGRSDTKPVLITLVKTL